jgi:hypothetical protein
VHTVDTRSHRHVAVRHVGCMTTTDDVTTTRVSGPMGILAAIPILLGFHPRRSLVVACLAGPCRRVGPVIRVDLPSGLDGGQALMLAGHAHVHADEVVVVAYQDTKTRRPFLDQVLRALRAAEIPVADVWVVRDGTAWLARTRAEQQAHRGFPVPDENDPEVQELAAVTAYSGRAVLESREALAASIAGPTGARLIAAERAIDRAAGTAPAAGVESAEGRTLEALALVNECLGATEITGTVPLALAAELAVALQDARVRHAVVARAVVDVEREWPAMLVACASQIPNAQAGPLCAVLAVAGYRHGDGALAQVAVDRSLGVEPGNELAHLMLACMSTGMHPAELERLADPGAGWAVGTDFP